MMEVCYCTVVYPGGRVVGYPESVNPICPMHGDSKGGDE